MGSKLMVVFGWLVGLFWIQDGYYQLIKPDQVPMHILYFAVCFGTSMMYLDILGEVQKRPLWRVVLFMYLLVLGSAFVSAGYILNGNFWVGMLGDLLMISLICYRIAEWRVVPVKGKTKSE